MRLLIDLQGLQSGSSRDRGIGRYVTALARAILRNGAGHDIQFLLNGAFVDQAAEIVERFADLASPRQFHSFSVPGPSGALQVENGWRRQAAHLIYAKVIDDLAPDALLIGSLFEGGNDNVVVGVGDDERAYLTAIILYDLIPLLNPAAHLGNVAARRWYFDKIEEMRRADLLLGISQSACNEGIVHLPSDERQVRHIGAAAGEEFTDTDSRDPRLASIASDLLAYYEIDRPFVMHTSAFDARKNFEGLIAAFGRLPPAVRDAHQLVLVCKLTPATRNQLRKVVAESGLGERDVILTGFVPDDELRSLYANCKLLAFPSFHEGFGLPVVEAMWCGAPAIGSRLSSVPEVIGREDALFDPHDLDDMARVLQRALTDQPWLAELEVHASRHARTFSWDEIARRALTVIEQRVSERDTGSSSIAMEALIERLAKIDVWPGPTDADLLSCAKALDSNEQLRWRCAEGRGLGIHNAVSL